MNTVAVTVYEGAFDPFWLIWLGLLWIPVPILLRRDKIRFEQKRMANL